MSKDKPVLVIGAGSIGERHIRNLWMLGYRNIIVYRQRNLPFRDIGEAKVKVLTNWAKVIRENCVAAIVCTPTAQHYQQVMDCIKAGMHVMVEKPLWHKLFNKENLLEKCEQKNVLLQVGYMLRYHPLLKKIKQIIEDRRFGSLLNIQTYWGEYLPNWHSWEDYKQSYAANEASGGGAALTLSHDIDLVQWLVEASLQDYQSMHSYASLLGTDTDNAFDVNLRYDNNVTAHVHVNFFQKVAQRCYKLVFDDAVIDIDYYTSSMQIKTEDIALKEALTDFDRNNLFVDELTDFFKRIEQGDFAAFTQRQINDSYNIIKICTNVSASCISK